MNQPLLRRTVLVRALSVVGMVGLGVKRSFAVTPPTGTASRSAWMVYKPGTNITVTVDHPGVQTNSLMSCVFTPSNGAASVNWPVFNAQVMKSPTADRITGVFAVPVAMTTPPVPGKGGGAIVTTTIPTSGTILITITDPDGSMTPINPPIPIEPVNLTPC